MRGGGPPDADKRTQNTLSSPHARGWSQHIILRDEMLQVFPACAGVVPQFVQSQAVHLRLPRMRGGGPQAVAASGALEKSSPHARGWSRREEGP